MVWNWPVNRDGYVWNSFMYHRHWSFHWFEKKNLRKTVWAMMALYHMIFYMILSCYKLSIKLDFVQFSIVGSIMLICCCRSFRCTWKPLLLFEYVFWFESLMICVEGMASSGKLPPDSSMKLSFIHKFGSGTNQRLLAAPFAVGGSVRAQPSALSYML